MKNLLTCKENSSEFLILQLPLQSKDTLFVIFAGSNDMLNSMSSAGFKKLLNATHQSNSFTVRQNLISVLQNTATAKQKEQYGAIASLFSTPVNNTLAAVNVLHQNRVPFANIVVFNLPDIALTPQVQGQNKLLQTVVTLIADVYNFDLAFTLAAHHSQYLFRSTFNDFKWMRDVLNNRSSYDIRPKPSSDKVSSNCISELGNGYFKTGQYISSCHVNTNPSNKYFFFVNGKHLTTYAQSLLADAICNQFVNQYSGFSCK